MTTYAWPAAFRVEAFDASLVPNSRTFQSPYAGSTQTLDLLGERWRFILTLPGCSHGEAAAREAFFNKLMSAHRISLHHMARPIPRGTMRGSPTVSGSHAQGAQTLVIASAGAGATVLAGDLIGVAGQLFQAADDTTADGSGNASVPLVNRVRVALTGGAAVVWNKPTATFIVKHVPTQYSPGMSHPQMVECLEAFA